MRNLRLAARAHTALNAGPFRDAVRHRDARRAARRPRHAPGRGRRGAGIGGAPPCRVGAGRPARRALGHRLPGRAGAAQLGQGGERPSQGAPGQHVPRRPHEARYRSLRRSACWRAIRPARAGAGVPGGRRRGVGRAHGRRPGPRPLPAGAPGARQALQAPSGGTCRLLQALLLSRGAGRKSPLLRSALWVGFQCPQLRRSCCRPA